MLQRMHTDTEKRDDENETDDGNLKKITIFLKIVALNSNFLTISETSNPPCYFYKIVVFDCLLFRIFHSSNSLFCI